METKQGINERKIWAEIDAVDQHYDNVEVSKAMKALRGRLNLPENWD